MLNRGCRDRARWRLSHPGQPLDLFVNVSARQVTGLGFADKVTAAQQESDMDPAALVLETTAGVET